MKTRKRKNVLKYMVVFTCILLCTSFFVVPVSAADDLVSSQFKIEINDPHTGDLRVFRYGGNAENSFLLANGSIFVNAQAAESYEMDREQIGFTYDWVDSRNGGVISLWLGESTFTSDPLSSDNLHTYSKNDTVWMDGSQFDALTDTDFFSLTSYRFVLRSSSNIYEIGKVVATTDVQDCYINTNSIDPIKFDSLKFTFLESVECHNLALCLELYGTSMNNFNLSIVFRESFFTINYGRGTSPNYPMYPSAPGGTEVDDLESLEQEAMDSSSAGIEEGLSLMQDLGGSLEDLELGNFPIMAIRLGNMFMEIPGFNGLIYVSLSLGLFGSLMGLAGSIISAADRSARSAKREAAVSQRSSQRSSRKG